MLILTASNFACRFSFMRQGMNLSIKSLPVWPDLYEKSLGDFSFLLSTGAHI